MGPRMRHIIEWALDLDQIEANQQQGGEHRVVCAHRTRRTCNVSIRSVLPQAQHCPVSEAERNLDSRGDQSCHEQV
eukprot:491715-Pyramimonas_sp.AAC.1